jgi:hypothetical protein
MEDTLKNFRKLMRKRYNPDGHDSDGTPYWVLPSDRKTYSYEEWAEAYMEFIKNR